MDCSPASGQCSPVLGPSPRHRSTLRSDSRHFDSHRFDGRHFDSRRSGTRHFEIRHFDSRHSVGRLSDSRRCIQEAPSGTWKRKKNVNFIKDFQAIIIGQDMAPIG
jgi:hypothetical protein